MNVLEKLMQFEIHNEDNPDIIAKFGAIHIALLSLASNKDRNHAEELLSASADVFLKLSENEMSEEGAEFQKVFDKKIYLETGLRYFDYLYSEAMLKDLEPKDIFKRKG